MEFDNPELQRHDTSPDSPDVITLVRKRDKKAQEKTEMVEEKTEKKNINRLYEIQEDAEEERQA